MLDTMTRFLEAVRDRTTSYNLRQILFPAVDHLSTQMLTSAGLLISGSGGVTAKTGSGACYAVVQGNLLSIAGSTAMPSLVGCNFAAGHYNVAAFYSDNQGNLTMLPGIQGATLGAVTLPTPLAGQVLVGMLIITYASAFVGGTTALDTATTVYVSPVGGFDPTALTG